jgi:lysylphosphatidylglycerol synthetase-like protein (DUF2156 family)
MAVPDAAAGPASTGHTGRDLKMPSRPLSVTASLLLILISALIWLTLGILIAVGAHPAIPKEPSVQAALASGSMAAAGVLIGLLILLAKRIRLAYFLVLAAMTASSLAVFFDDVGWTDLVFLFINLVPLFLLVKDRAWYLSAGGSPRL